MLRVIRQHRWDSPDKCDWLPEGELPADPLADFANTSDNCLSLWAVDDKKDGLKRVLAALAANRDKADKLDYVLFAQAHLEAIGVESRQTSGTTPDQHVNEQHQELTHLSAQKVLAVTQRVWHDRLELRRVDKVSVVQLDPEGVRDGRILAHRLRPKLLDDVRRHLSGEDRGPRLPR